MELKGVYELDSNNITGFYVEGHFDKAEFLQLVKDSLEDFLSEDDIDEMKTPMLEDIEHIWYKEVSDTEDFEFDNEFSDHYFLFSYKAKDDYSLMTKYEL